MSEGRLTRRDLFQVTAIATGAAVATACAGAPAPAATATMAPEETAEAATAPAAATEAPTATAAPAVEAAPSKYGEALMLAELVQAGKLPPVEERLPKEPMVIPVTEEIGQYGGVWHRCAIGPSDAYVIDNRLNYNWLFRFSEDGESVVPCVAKAYEVNEDATEFTIFLCEGMKWSDGEPFTADDFVFGYEDVLLNEALTPVFPKYLRDPENDQPMVLEKVDDYSFKIRFQSAYGLFPQILAGADGRFCQYWVKHYLQKFHPNYTDEEELARMASDEGFDNWWQLYQSKAAWADPDCPHLWPWLPKRVPPESPVVCERNPYYWKTDPDGNQLPYIDRVQFDIVENADLLNLKAVAGEIDMQLRHYGNTRQPGHSRTTGPRRRGLP